MSIYKNPDQILFAVSYFLFPLERVFTISLICKVFRGSAPNISYRTGFFSKVLSRSSQNTAAAAAAAPLQSCPTVRPHRQQPTRLCCPWDSPGKNTGVGCHFLLQCMKVKSESEVAQSCLTLATPWTAAHQAPLSMGFSRQKYWSGLPLPSPIFEGSKITADGDYSHEIKRCLLLGRKAMTNLDSTS